MHFARKESILLVLFYFIIPALVVFYWFSFKRKSALLAKFANTELLEALIASTNRKMQMLKITLLLIVMFYFIVGWAGPQLGTKLETVKRQGVDIMIALDVSLSMMAEDIAPNRLEKAKHEIENLIDKLEGDRVGLIAFSGVAFIQCPLTLDYGAAKIFLDIMRPDLIPEPGTKIGKAITTAMKAFDQKERKHKVLVLITDGEDHEGDPMKAAEEAEKQGVRIYTVGLGSPDGVPIPITDERGASRNFKKDNEGKVVTTKLDQITLEKIALQTKGKYFRASSNEAELDKIYEDIAQMEKKELASKKFSQYEDRFQFILLFALFLLVAELFLPERRQINRT
ncbi:VWA domain-containing protein [candidate division KSB1 bacterium]|nr:VWA domain-containing protein [candidate division KSB1 bacterium]